MTVTTPTADDTRVTLSDGTELVEIWNSTVHLMPFVGFLWTPNDRLYGQGFLQYDVDVNGNPVLINADGMGLAPSGRINDATFQFLDMGFGYWLRHRRDSHGRLPGVAVTAELHWNQSLARADVVSRGSFRIGDFTRSLESWNMTVGTHLACRGNWTVSIAYGTPLAGGPDRPFDGELRLALNKNFGPSTRATRARF
jgi:hypothetical protein